MDTIIKRKNIDLPVETLQKLSLMAVTQGKSLKAYIEQVLIAKAGNIAVEVSDNPSPSNDKWFEDSQNLESVRRGMADLKAGRKQARSIDEIKDLLGV